MVALPVGGRSGEYDRRTVGADGHAPELRGPHRIRDLNVGGESNPQETTLIAAPPAILIGAEVLDAQGVEDGVEGVGIGTAVVHLTRRCGERKHLGVDEVSAAQLGGIHADLDRVPIHDPFDPMGGLRATRPPVRPHRNGGGYPGFGRELEFRYVVRTSGHHLAEHRKEGTDPRMGTRVLVDVEAVGSQGAVAVSAEGGGELQAPPVGEVQHRLAPGLDPAHRTTRGSGGESHHDVLGVAAVLGSETATDLRGDDPDVACLYTTAGRQ